MVYLLHFDKQIAPGKHTTQHYIGYADVLEHRLAEHASGHGARLTQVAIERGISWQVARTWQGGRQEERRLKKIHGARLCPICNPGNKRGQQAPAAAAVHEDSDIQF